MGATRFAVKNVDEKYFAFGPGGRYLVKSMQSSGRVSDDVLRVAYAAAASNGVLVNGLFLARSSGKTLNICVSDESLDDEELQAKKRKLVEALNGTTKGIDLDDYSFHGVKINLIPIRGDAFERMKNVLVKAQSLKASRMVDTRFAEAKSPEKPKKQTKQVKRQSKKVQAVRKHQTTKQKESRINEERLAELLNLSLDHFKESLKPVHLRIEERNNKEHGINFLNPVEAFHVGDLHGYDLADIQIRLADGSIHYLSLKMPSAEEWNGQKSRLTNHPYFEQIVDMFLSQEDVLVFLKDPKARRKKKGIENRQVSFVDGTTGIAMPLPRKYMSWMLFGEDSHTKCCAAIVNHFLPGDEDEVIYEEFNDHCQITIKVDKVVLSPEDVIGTSMEPWIIMRRRSSDAGVLWMARKMKCSGMHFYATTQSRVFSSETGREKDSILILKPLIEEQLDVAA